MRHPDEMDIIGARPKAPVEELPLWRSSAAPPPTVLQSPADYAKLAAFSRDGLALNEIAARVAHAILDVQRSVAIWEVRVALGQVGVIANDGREKLAGLGGLCAGLGLVAVDRERPASWAMEILHKSHGNLNTVWVRPPDVGSYTRETRQRRIAA